MLLVGVFGLSGCFDSGPYYGGGPGYAYAPEYVAPYRGGPVYYPPTVRPDDGYRVPGREGVHYYNGGEHAWEHPHEAQPERRVEPEHRKVQPEHHEAEPEHREDHH